MFSNKRYAVFTALWVSLFCATVALFSASYQGAYAATEEETQADVLSIGGSVTEIVYALDQGHRLVARDTTSTWPAEANKLPNVGYMRALSPEGVLSVGPQMILSEEGAGPKETIDVLKAADVTFIEVPSGFDAPAIAQKIKVVGQALGVPSKAEALAREVTAALDIAAAQADAAGGPRKRVMFILSARGGKLMVAGQNTSADAIIRMAGGVNAVQGFEGYKPLTDEAAATAAPDTVLMMARGGDHSMAANELFALPALSLTPAAQSQSLITMNGLLMLGFGPRTAQAVTELNIALYGK